MTNPILAGFYPDPSIVRVNTDYYLVNSTFAYFPGIPVFHSKDLKNWKQIGNVVERPTQMDFLGDRVTRGLFAPAINYHKGLFYITCTQIDHRGNFVMTAKNPAGPWSDPVWLPQVQGIDPSLFFDRDKAYIVYNADAPDNKPLYAGHRTIRAFEFDPVENKVKGENQILVNGGVDISKKPVWIEGPHIMKVGNWYYLYAAEGGTSINHSEVVFRSKSALGPYVPYENNPILTQRGLPEDRKNPITSAGHAEFVNGPDGKTYAVFLAVRPYEGNYYNTGRETFIAPVKWQNEWPVINPNFREIQYQYTFGFPEKKQENTPPQSGNFSYITRFEKGLDKSFLFLRTHDAAWYKTSRKNGLVMRLKSETCMEKGHPAFIAKRQQHTTCTAATSLKFTATKPEEKAGLLAFQDENHFYFICKSIDDSGSPLVQLFKGTNSEKSMDLLEEVRLPNKQQVVDLKILADGAKYSFEYTSPNGTWIALKKDVDGKHLSTQVAGGFVGSVFALYATSSGTSSSNTATFRSFTYSGSDRVYNK
ncbi:glycoside hydrolase family 43 protein [Mucilaginibacter lacusdianchii]|uniref:glycoside hydrolase family 43 protein n=1 Tax=Mucilaginibacter lacusdianchii TaxID=2684211 RepID=UPI00131D2C8A|nr:glycoside hydrolase family 43 protein [Mucilaginibacter sp. JXJ CY 39]